MSSQLVKNKAVVVGALGAGMVLLVAGCSSSSSTPEASNAAPSQASATPGAPSTQVPGPPAGATEVSTKSVGEGATYTSYKTSATAASVTANYEATLKADGFSVTNSGGGGGGWGQYGGSGSEVGGNNGTTFVEVNAGGSTQGPTYFEICQGPSAAAVSSCQSGNHGQSSQS